MRNKTLTIAIATALMTSGVAMAQVKGPGTGTEPSGASTSAPVGILPGVVCSIDGGTDCNIAIPDSPGQPTPGVPAVSTLALGGCSGNITDVNVGVAATHTWVGDLSFTLIAPDNTSVALVERPGNPVTTFGCSGDNIVAVLDDSAGTSVENECAGGTPTINGTFQPDSGSLASLNGVDPNGLWTLEVTDSAGGDTGELNDWSLDISPAGCAGAGGEPAASIARFQVVKDFNDDNPASVDVEISCNTGLPISQPGTVEEGDPITFVVTDFNDGELDCEITETAVAGYTATYDNGDTTSDVSCVFEDVAFETLNVCTITNDLDQVEVEVTKMWFDDNPSFNPVNYAEASYSCVNEVFSQVSGTLEFLGDGATDSFYVFPDYDGSTYCMINESIVDSGVEVDDSDCSAVLVAPGSGGSCTIYNTRLYEGIPTLSQYGLAIMALLMLGVGFVAFRRVA